MNSRESLEKERNLECSLYTWSSMWVTVFLIHYREFPKVIFANTFSFKKPRVSFSFFSASDQATVKKWFWSCFYFCSLSMASQPKVVICHFCCQPITIFATSGEPCKRHDQSDGTCTPYRSCPALFSLDSRAKAEPKLKALMKKNVCETTSSKVMVCCPNQGEFE